MVLHVKMHDNSHRGQQEALGYLGVNLIYSCYHKNEDIEEILTSLSIEFLEIE